LFVIITLAGLGTVVGRATGEDFVFSLTAHCPSAAGSSKMSV
jgi:hypothetical protein